MFSLHSGDGDLVPVTSDGSLIIIDGKFLDLITKGKEVVFHNMHCSGKGQKRLVEQFLFCHLHYAFPSPSFPSTVGENVRAVKGKSGSSSAIFNQCAHVPKAHHGNLREDYF